MDKRYQVFVSSTYADLKEERQHVLQALMEMDCIPAGMELFPAADEEQWTFIQKVIDDCDYYLLIIGGRYGSVTPEGVSYTEKEFDYAVGKGLRIVALIHGEPDNIPFGKSESDPALREKLLSFKDRVMDGRLVKFWNSGKELPGLVALSLTKTIKMYPAIGWVRADAVASDELLVEVNQVRKKYEALSEKYETLALEKEEDMGDIVDIDTKFLIHTNYKHSYSKYAEKFEYSISWKELFSLLAPSIREHPTQKYVGYKIEEILKEKGNLGSVSYMNINEQDLHTIGIQFQAYGFINIRYSQTTKGDMALFWSLTERGEKYMLENRVIKK